MGNREENLKKARDWKANNKEKVTAYRKRYWEENKEREKLTLKLWKESNSDKYIRSKRESDKKYRERNLDKTRLYRQNNKFERNLRERERYYNDISYNIKIKLRASFRQAFNLQGLSKKERVLKYIGCSLDELKKHLEKKFRQGMNWDNNTNEGWHIDHILPVSSFDHSNEEQIGKCWHYSNLQPLWAMDNYRKSDKIIPLNQYN